MASPAMRKEARYEGVPSQSLRNKRSSLRSTPRSVLTTEDEHSASFSSAPESQYELTIRPPAHGEAHIASQRQNRSSRQSKTLDDAGDDSSSHTEKADQPETGLHYEHFPREFEVEFGSDVTKLFAFVPGKYGMLLKYITDNPQILEISPRTWFGRYLNIILKRSIRLSNKVVESFVIMEALKGRDFTYLKRLAAGSSQYLDDHVASVISMYETIESNIATKLPYNEKVPGTQRSSSNLGIEEPRHAQSTQTREDAYSALRPRTYPPERSDGSTNVSELSSLEGMTRLNNAYRVVRGKAEIDRTFAVGAVLAVLWHEPAGAGAENPPSNLSSPPLPQLTRGPLGDFIYSAIRRFIVFRKRHDHSLCVPIISYRGKEEHFGESARHALSIVHDAKQEPSQPQDGFFYTKDPIPVQLINGERLTESARINFGKAYTIEHNVRVKLIGRIPQYHIRQIILYARNELFGDV